MFFTHFIIVGVLLFSFAKDNEDLQAQSIAAGSQSTLPLPIQNLVRMIFDIEAMKQSLVEFEVRISRLRKRSKEYQEKNLVVDRN